MSDAATQEQPGQVWVDADACPAPIRQILFRAAERTHCPVTLFANHPLSVPRLDWVRFVQVPSGIDVADSEIVERVSAGDLVVTQDIPLAAAVVDLGAEAVGPRGEPYTRETVRQRLSMRNFMTELRDSGVRTGGPAPLGNADKQRFANLLDRWLARRSSR
ncbi:MAG: YaiI/YqxD family protein [Pseudomonadota bacterium]